MVVIVIQGPDLLNLYQKIDTSPFNGVPNPLAEPQRPEPPFFFSFARFSFLQYRSLFIDR